MRDEFDTLLRKLVLETIKTTEKFQDVDLNNVPYKEIDEAKDTLEQIMNNIKGQVQLKISDPCPKKTAIADNFQKLF